MSGYAPAAPGQASGPASAVNVSQEGGATKAVVGATALDSLTASIASAATATGVAAAVPANAKSLVLVWAGIVNMCVVDVEFIDAASTVIARWTAWLKDGVSHTIALRSRRVRLRIVNPGVNDAGTTATAVTPTCSLYASEQVPVGQYYRMQPIVNATLTATLNMTNDFRATPNAHLPLQGNDRRVYYVALGTVSGTAPTLNVTHETSSDGTTQDDTGAGANITAASSISSVNIGAAGALRQQVFNNRLRVVIGGTTPSFGGTYITIEGWLMP